MIYIYLCYISGASYRGPTFENVFCSRSAGIGLCMSPLRPFVVVRYASENRSLLLYIRSLLTLFRSSVARRGGSEALEKVSDQ
jgi:hypothetical protein